MKRKRVALPMWTPKPGVPATRGDCVDGERPCPYVRCRYHLWLEDGEDRPGARHDGRAPATSVRPAWFGDPVFDEHGVEVGRVMPPSCALDVADAVAAHGAPELTVTTAAHAGIRSSRLRAMLADALGKLEGYKRESER